MGTIVQFGVIPQRFKQDRAMQLDMGNKRLTGMQGKLHGIKQSSKTEVKIPAL